MVQLKFLSMIRVVVVLFCWLLFFAYVYARVFGFVLFGVAVFWLC